MNVDAWLAAATEDALTRGLPDLVPLLEGLAIATAALRRADEARRAPADVAQTPTSRES